MTPASADTRDPTPGATKGPGSPPAAVQALIDTYADGATPEQIASSLPVSVQDVRKMLRDHGVQLRPQDAPRKPGPKPGARPRRGHPIPPDQEDAVIAAYTDDQLSMRDCAARFGVGQEDVRDLLDRRSVARHRPGRRPRAASQRQALKERMRKEFSGLPPGIHLVPAAQLAAVFDAPDSAVAEVRRQLAAEDVIHPGGKTYLAGAMSTVDEMVAGAFRRGLTRDACASELGLTYHRVREALNRQGITGRAPRRPPAAPAPALPPAAAPAAAGHAGDGQGTIGGDLDLGENDPRAYIQIAWRVARQIQDGTLATGCPAPSITTLTHQTGHSRITCGKALRRLEDSGLLTRYPGLGYYVTSPDSGSTRHQATAAPEADRPAAEIQKPATRPQPSPVPASQQAVPSGERAPGSTAADIPDQPPQAIFRPPAPAEQPARQHPAVVPDQLTEDSPDVPLENVFELPGAWPPGEPHLYWLVAPVDEPSSDAAQTLAMRYQSLTGTACLTPVPPRWLHITIGHAGLADELTAPEQARLVSIVREQADQLPAFTVTTSPAEVTQRGVICRAQPHAPLRRLEALTADALKATGHHCPPPPAVLPVPHMVLAHATRDGTTGPQSRQLTVIPGMQAKIRVLELRLVKARHDGHQITWRPIETIPLGNARTKKPR